MAIKSILCILSGVEGEIKAAKSALEIAMQHNAHTTFLYISQEPSSYIGLLGEGMIVSYDIYQAIEKENRIKLERTEEQVTLLTKEYGALLSTKEKPLQNATAIFRHIVGAFYDSVSSEGRLCDLIVIGKGDNGIVYDIAAPALFNSGRPLLVVPSTGANTKGVWSNKIVALAWNGTLQAARALYNALPLISGCEKLYVLSAQKSGEVLSANVESGLMEYLEFHGLQAQYVAVAAGQRSIGEALLIRAGELRADLLVMGAYHHSTLREMILGGVTQYMLEKSDIPLLLSH